MKFKELSVDCYFQFASNDTIYKKLSAGRIRKLGKPGIIRYLKNEIIESLGYDISQFVLTIHVKVQKTQSDE